MIKKALIKFYAHREFLLHKETCWIITGTIGVYAVALVFEYDFEYLYAFSRNYEEWDLDEIFILMIISSVSLLVIFFRSAWRLKKELERCIKAEQELIDTAHKAGMADIATGVLHNIGNLLNSVNTSVGVLRVSNDKSVVSNIYKANDLLRENFENMENFILENPKGKKLLLYYLEIENVLRKENEKNKEDIKRLSEKVNTIEEVINVQQQYAAGVMIVSICLWKEW